MSTSVVDPDVKDSRPKAIIEQRSLLKGALTLVAALAWNETAKKIVAFIYPVGNPDDAGRALTATLIYAILVTIVILVLVGTYNSVKVRGIAGTTTSAINKCKHFVTNERDPSTRL
jgi:hypothetical protein